MTLKEYCKNLVWPVIFLLIMSVNLYQNQDMRIFYTLWLVCLISTPLYPYSKLAIEKFALIFTSRDYWHSGLLYDTPAKNGLYVLYYGFCYILAVPIVVMSLIFLLVKKAT